MQKRLESNIRQGLFSSISNIPYELSKLKQEIDSLSTQISKFERDPFLLRRSHADLNELRARLAKKRELHILLSKHREGRTLEQADYRPESSSQPDDQTLNMDSSSKKKEDEQTLRKAQISLKQMQDRQIREHKRKQDEHNGLFGWQRLAHERERAMNFAERVETRALDSLFKAKSVSEIT